MSKYFLATFFSLLVSASPGMEKEDYDRLSPSGEMSLKSQSTLWNVIENNIPFSLHLVADVPASLAIFDPHYTLSSSAKTVVYGAQWLSGLVATYTDYLKWKKDPTPTGLVHWVSAGAHVAGDILYETAYYMTTTQLPSLEYISSQTGIPSVEIGIGLFYAGSAISIVGGAAHLWSMWQISKQHLDAKKRK